MQKLAGIILLVGIAAASAFFLLLFPVLLLNRITGRFENSSGGFILSSAQDWITWVVSLVTWVILGFCGHKLEQFAKKPVEKPTGAGLLVLGLLSIILGPFTAVPGLILSKRYRPFTIGSKAGYWLCWIFLFLNGFIMVGLVFFGDSQ